MKRIQNWNDLRPYGLHLLSGESCGLTYRRLCDVTEQGKRVLEKCLSCELRLSERWDRGAPEEPHVGSIMLAPQMLAPLGVFALLEAGCTEVWLYTNGSLLGIESDDAPDLIERCRKLAPEALARTFRYGGTASDHNVHVMSGRVQ